MGVEHEDIDRHPYERGRRVVGRAWGGAEIVRPCCGRCGAVRQARQHFTPEGEDLTNG